VRSDGDNRSPTGTTPEGLDRFPVGRPSRGRKSTPAATARNHSSLQLESESTVEDWLANVPAGRAGWGTGKLLRPQEPRTLDSAAFLPPPEVPAAARTGRKGAKASRIRLRWSLRGQPQRFFHATAAQDSRTETEMASSRFSAPTFPNFSPESCRAKVICWAAAVV
jgi:hypothetical protein